MSAPTDDGIYFRQLLSGRDFAQTDQIAQQMVNFCYLIGDRESGECVVVDPAYDIDGITATAAGDDMRITGALVTHYHPDHCGGDMMGFRIEGIERLLELGSVPIHVQAAEVPWVLRVTGLSEHDLVSHSSGDVVEVGRFPITLLHTPGHTPGSQCFMVEGCLVSGDTLFLDGCGRTDLPGGDPDELYLSLTQRLAAVPGDTVLYPGHRYSPAGSAPMSDVRTSNFVFTPNSAEQWRAMFGGG